MDDRPAVVASARDDEVLRCCRRPEPAVAAAGEYVARAAADWAEDTRYTWAVCEPTTGEMLGEVALTDLDAAQGRARLGVWMLAPARRRGLATAAATSVLRFAVHGLGLDAVTCRWAEANVAAGRLAHRCGFVVEGRQADVLVGRRPADR